MYLILCALRLLSSVINRAKIDDATLSLFTAMRFVNNSDENLAESLIRKCLIIIINHKIARVVPAQFPVIA